MPLPFVGPSYGLEVSRLDVQRSINLHLQGVETPGKAPFVLKSVPGQKLWIGLGAEIRCEWVTGQGRAFAVAGNTLFELFADQTSAARGTLLTGSGPVRMADGNTQLVVVDGDNGYVLRLALNAFEQITTDAWLGSWMVAFINNYFLFCEPDTGKYYSSAIDDATNINALDFATAEYKADNISAMVVENEDLRLLGTTTSQLAYSRPDADNFPFSIRNGASIDVGCVAKFSAGSADTGSFWIGGDRNGGGIVYLSRGRQAQRISTAAIEEMLRKSTDLTAATAYSYQRNGLTFICFDAPGLETTLCYEIAAGQWHERGELDEYGNFVPSRVTCHMYAFGRNLVGDRDGNISELDENTYQILGRTLKRRRRSPHAVKPNRSFQRFNAFVLDCDTGGAPVGVKPFVELSYSNDSGGRWSDPAPRTTGLVGQRKLTPTWTLLGRAKDRVWQLDCSANAPLTIIDAFVEVE